MSVISQKMFVFRKFTSLQPRALQTTLAVIILSFLSALGHFQKVTLLGAFHAHPFNRWIFKIHLLAKQLAYQEQGC